MSSEVATQPSSEPVAATEPKSTHSLDKVTRVLGLFSVDQPEWGVTDAARALELPKSTASWVMIQLAEQGLLRRVRGRRYRLGWRLFELSQTLLETTDFRAEARRAMERLSATYSETVQLAVLDGVETVYMEKVQPTPAVKIELSRVGSRLPAHCTGLGKAMLAFEPWEAIGPELARSELTPVTPNTITDLQVLREELEVVRRQGFALDREESMEGLCCVAVPLRDPSGGVIAALSISAPAFRFESRSQTYIAAVLEAASNVTASGARAARLVRRDLAGTGQNGDGTRGSETWASRL